MCEMGRNEEWSHKTCFEGLMLENVGQEQSFCPMSIQNGPSCQTQKTKIGTIISSYDNITINGPTKSSIFEDKTSSCADVCLIQALDEKQTFTCGNVNYLIPGTKMEMETTVVIKETFKNFTFKEQKVNVDVNDVFSIGNGQDRILKHETRTMIRNHTCSDGFMDDKAISPSNSREYCKTYKQLDTSRATY